MTADELPEGIAPTGNAAIDRAIASVEHQPLQMRPFTIALLGNQGRPVQIAIPVDLTDEEALGLVFGVLQAVDAVRLARKPISPILVPRH